MPTSTHGPPPHVYTVDDDTLQSFLHSAPVVVLDFWRPGCGPCRAQQAPLRAFAVAHPHVNVGAVNIDNNEVSAAQFGIHSTPSLVVVVHGVPILGTIGVQTAAQLHRLINRPEVVAARNGGAS